MLERNGMVPVDMVNGMSMDLADRGPGMVWKSSVHSLDIITVVNDRQLDSWLSVVDACIFRGKSLDRDLFGKLIGLRDLKLYLGSFEGQPVSTCMAFHWDNVAGYYNIATLPEFRKMGFGHALTTHAIRSSTKQGIRLGILHATKMGESLYSNIGFNGYGQLWIYWMQGKEFRNY